MEIIWAVASAMRFRVRVWGSVAGVASLDIPHVHSRAPHVWIWHFSLDAARPHRTAAYSFDLPQKKFRFLLYHVYTRLPRTL